MIYPRAIAIEGYKYGNIAVATRGFIVTLIIVVPAKPMHKPFVLEYRETHFVLPPKLETETVSDMDR